MNDDLYDVDQVQHALRVSRRTVFNLISRGELTGFKAGRSWRFRKEDIDAYETRQRQKAEQQLREKQEDKEEQPC